MQEDNLFNQELQKLSPNSPILNEDHSLPNPLYMFFKTSKPASSCTDVDVLVDNRRVQEKLLPKKELLPVKHIHQEAQIHEIEDQSELENNRKIERAGKLQGDKEENRAKKEDRRAKSTHCMTTRLKKRSDPWFNADVEICSASEALAALSLSTTRQDQSLSLRFNLELQRLKNRSFRKVS